MVTSVIGSQNWVTDHWESRLVTQTYLIGLKDAAQYQDDICCKSLVMCQGLKIALVRSYLRVPQAAGHVKILMFLVEITFFPIYANNFYVAGQVPIFGYFEACVFSKVNSACWVIFHAFIVVCCLTFQENVQSVKQFGTRSGLTFGRS